MRKTMESKTTDQRDKIIADLINRAINPPIYVHPASKLADDLKAYIHNTKRPTKAGLSKVLHGR